MEPEPVKPEDIYNIVLVSSPAARPDGGAVAYVATRPRRDYYESSIWLASGDGYEPVSSGPSDVCPAWSPDGRLLAFVRGPSRRSGGERKWRIMVASPGRGEAWTLLEVDFPIRWIEWRPTGDGLVAIARVPWGRRGEEREEAYVVERLPAWFNGEGWVHDSSLAVLVVDYPGGGWRRVSPERVDSWGARWSPDGRLLAYVRAPDDLHPYRHEIVVVDVETGEERVVAGGLTVSGLAWSPDATMLAVRGHRGERGPASHHRVMIYSLAGELVSCPSCGLDRNTLSTVNSDVRGPSCSVNLEWAGDGRVYFLVHDAGSVHLYASLPGGEPQPVVEAENAVVDEFTVYREGPVVYYTLMRATEPKEIYVLGEEGGVRLTGHNDHFLRRKLIAEPRHYRVETRYGGYIDVWVLPPARGGECEGCTPWVLYIHGGPKTSYGHGFIHEFHALSGAGYAVVYSNPHGSDGYSEEFADIRGAFGTIDYEDLMTVAEAAPSLDPELDASRAAVAGGSYGGWMTAYITAKTGMFRAAVAQRGCVNWTSFYGASDIGWYFAAMQLGARPWEDPQAYTAKSPLFHADKIRTPTLIIHSTEDYRCPLDQALTHYTMLREVGVEARLVVFPGENHDLSRSGTPKRRVRRIREIIAWLDKHLKQGATQ